MKSRGKILVVGASIAGPCLAYWLSRYGYEVIVIEKAESFRDGGQNIDVKELGQVVIERMHLIKKVDAKNTGELGVRFVDSNGRTVAEFPKEADLSLTSSFEILRGDLARLLYDETKEKCEYRFGVTISKILESSDGLEVSFHIGAAEKFDLLICADGMGSTTRKLAGFTGVKFNYLGLMTSYFRIPQIAGEGDWARWYNAEGKVVLLRPGHTGETTASVFFLEKNLTRSGLSLAEQKSRVRKVLRGAGWECDRVADQLDYETDFYFGPLGQIKASRWSKGRIALVGDAAYSPSPITGMGTSLALAGAYILAGEINKNEDHAEAFKAYEKIFRPYVEKSQKLFPGVPRLAYPKSRLGISLLRSAMKFAASDVVQKTMQKFSGTKDSQLNLDQLPIYE